MVGCRPKVQFVSHHHQATKETRAQLLQFSHGEFFFFGVLGIRDLLFIVRDYVRLFGAVHHYRYTRHDYIAIATAGDIPKSGATPVALKARPGARPGARPDKQMQAGLEPGRLNINNLCWNSSMNFAFKLSGYK